MPLLRFDLIEGRTDVEVKTLLDAAHRAMLAAFEVPERDRYQIVQEHKPGHMIVEDTGLGNVPDKVIKAVAITRGRAPNRGRTEEIPALRRSVAVRFMVSRRQGIGTPIDRIRGSRGRTLRSGQH